MSIFLNPAFVFLLTCFPIAAAAADNPVADIEHLRAAGDFRQARVKTTDAIASATDPDLVRSLKNLKNELSTLMAETEKLRQVIPRLGKPGEEGAAARTQLDQFQPEAIVHALLRGLDQADPVLTEALATELQSYKRKEVFAPLLARCLVPDGKPSAPPSLRKALIAQAAFATETQLLSILDFVTSRPAEAAFVSVISIHGGSPAVIRSAWSKLDSAPQPTKAAILAYLLSRPMEDVLKAASADPLRLRPRLIELITAKDPEVQTWKETLVGAVGFVREDRKTQGSWRGVYGAAGINQANLPPQLPAGASVAVSGNQLHTWADSTQDVRAMQRPAGDDRIAACFHAHGANFTLEVNGGNSYQFAVYALDWDQNDARSQVLELSEPKTSAVLDSREITKFSQGVYLVYRGAGTMRLQVRPTNPQMPSAVICAVLFDPAVPSTEGAGLHASWLPTWKQAQAEANPAPPAPPKKP